MKYLEFLKQTNKLIINKEKLVTKILINTECLILFSSSVRPSALSVINRLMCMLIAEFLVSARVLLGLYTKMMCVCFVFSCSLY